MLYYLVYILLVLIIFLYLRHFSPIIITYTLLDSQAKKPTRAYHKAACWDLYALRDVSISSFNWKLIPTGVAFAPWPHIHIPFLHISFTPLGNVAGEILTKSGLAKRKGARAHLGVMDNDYRDEWSILMFNHNPNFPMTIRKGEKVAQIRFYRVPHVYFIHTKRLSESLRGTKGFGSSGNT
jgi:dUTP pyrophosphatase